MRPTPYVASLRVYEPIEEFPDRNRDYWKSLPLDENSYNREQTETLKKSLSFNFSDLKLDEVHILDIGGKRFCCPWSLWLRFSNSYSDFKSTIPESLFPFFFKNKSKITLEQFGELFLDKVSHIKTETWSIPPRWFGLFSSDERVYGRQGDEFYSLARTKISKAIKRCQFMQNVVFATFVSGEIVQEIGELSDWLASFHQESILELDYGGLASYMQKVLGVEGINSMNEDTSIDDLAKSLAGLANRDGKTAGNGYENLISRWRRVAAYEQAM